MIQIAVLSNPKSTGNHMLLPRIRQFCAQHDDIFHDEVSSVEHVSDALHRIAAVKPRILVINGGDGTVQAALTEIYHGDHFGDKLPPMAVLPNGKTNLIALDLGATGDPMATLDRILEIARSDVSWHLVTRELIALSDGNANCRPVLGMFLGGAGLADTMLYCRNRVYPLGLPNGLSHVLTAVALLVSLILPVRSHVLPAPPQFVRIELVRQGQLLGNYAVLIVTTLHKLLLGVGTSNDAERPGGLRLMAIDRSFTALCRTLVAGIFGRLGKGPIKGVHLRSGDEIRILGEKSNVILDGEIFEASNDHPIVLKPTAPVQFLALAS